MEFSADIVALIQHHVDHQDSQQVSRNPGSLTYCKEHRHKDIDYDDNDAGYKATELNIFSFTRTTNEKVFKYADENCLKSFFIQVNLEDEN